MSMEREPYPPEYDHEDPCPVCLKHDKEGDDGCKCPECPICTEVGNLDCFGTHFGPLPDRPVEYACIVDGPSTTDTLGTFDTEEEADAAGREWVVEAAGHDGCPDCEGSGIVNPRNPMEEGSTAECSACDGTGANQEDFSHWTQRVAQGDLGYTPAQVGAAACAMGIMIHADKPWQANPPSPVDQTLTTSAILMLLPAITDMDWLEQISVMLDHQMEQCKEADDTGT